MDYPDLALGRCSRIQTRPDAVGSWPRPGCSAPRTTAARLNAHPPKASSRCSRAQRCCLALFPAQLQSPNRRPCWNSRSRLPPLMANAALCKRHVTMVPSRTVVAADERAAPRGRPGLQGERRLGWGLLKGGLKRTVYSSARIFSAIAAMVLGSPAPTPQFSFNSSPSLRGST